jgi:arylsulfatase A-like enzyme
MRLRFATGLIVVAALSSCGAEKPAAPVNIVLISIDSLRSDHIGAYGYPRPTAPTLDRLAAEGALFENVVAESSWTLPSHMTMLTGLSTLAHGVDSFAGGRLDDTRTTLAERLRDAGYQTWGIYSGPYLHPVFGFGKGFDRYEGILGETTALDREGFDLGTPEAGREVMSANSRAHRTVTSERVSKRAIELLRQRRERPFFLFLHYFDVHYDYIPPESLWRRFDPEYKGTLTAEGYRRNPAIHRDMNSEDLRHVIALYDGEILHTDGHIGSVIEALEGLGLTEETLVVVTSDHGDEFFEHGRKGHGQSLFDEVLMVPLIVRLPGRIQAGLRIREQVRHLEIGPTILSYAGIRADLEGTELGGVLAGRSSLPELDAVSTLRRNGLSLSLRMPKYKYLLHREGTSMTETLYHLTRDPREQEPVQRSEMAATAQTLELFDRLRGQLLRNEQSAIGGHSTGEVELPAEVIEQLRSLGYISQDPRE